MRYRRSRSDYMVRSRFFLSFLTDKRWRRSRSFILYLSTADEERCLSCESIEALSFFKGRLICTSCLREIRGPEKIPDEVSYFFDRPFKVMSGGEIACLIANQIVDTDIRKLSQKRLIGNIDQFTDNTDFRNMNKWSEGEGVTQEKL